MFDEEALTLSFLISPFALEPDALLDLTEELESEHFTLAFPVQSARFLINFSICKILVVSIQSIRPNLKRNHPLSWAPFKTRGMTLVSVFLAYITSSLAHCDWMELSDKANNT